MPSVLSVERWPLEVQNVVTLIGQDLACLTLVSDMCNLVGLIASSPSTHLLKQHCLLTLPRHPQILQELHTDVNLRLRVARAHSVRMPWVSIA